MNKRFLADLSPAEFLRKHWQRKPLVARNALAGYAGVITRDELFDLASRSDVESRIVTRAGGSWQVLDGPFVRGKLRRLPRTGWTLLVQGVDHALSQGASLLREFAFIPYARLDDLMVSYAAPGGGVGPHADSYDVFLVQGQGKRRWRISGQRDLELVSGAPLKLLANFRPEREWTFSAGDALYLPPQYAHEGVAIGECITYSIGFRAPTHEELSARFLEFLQDRLDVKGRYADPDLRPTARPAQISAHMLKKSASTLARLRWSNRDIAEFIGRYLSEPKPTVVFEPPAHPLGRSAFTRLAAQRGLRLAGPSRMLFHGRSIFMNGELVVSRGPVPTLITLANARELRPPLVLDANAARILYEWYDAGYIELA